MKARVPNALPYLFTALKIAAPTSVITAFVAEYFGGRQNGLGSPSLELRQLEECRSVGVRHRGVPVGADVLPGLRALGVHHYTQTGLRPGGATT